MVGPTTDRQIQNLPDLSKIPVRCRLRRRHYPYCIGECRDGRRNFVRDAALSEPLEWSAPLYLRFPARGLARILPAPRCGHCERSRRH